MKLTKNISLHELKCNCCDEIYKYPAIIAYHAQQIVNEFGNSWIIINSATRCEIKNSSVNGTLGSKHLVNTDGDAIDFNIVNKKTKKAVDTSYLGAVCDMLYPNDKGIIIYPNFVHFDTRSSKYRL